MENVVEVLIDESAVKAHELTVVTAFRPDALPPVTLARAGGQRALLYACEGLTPVARYRTEPGSSLTLSGLFDLLCGYIGCLLSARDRLLDTRLLSSDPARGVFASQEAASVKAIWGADEALGEGEKICRVAMALAGRDRVIGAKTSMERMMGIIRSENLSLRDCLKTAESLCRSWNRFI